MKDERPSTTAAIVAAFRSLGDLLPSEAQLAHDPYGARFTGAWLERAIDGGRLAPAMRGPVRRYVLYMQVRTKAIDDVLLSFVRGGGRQVVVLGAGFDARALRFAEELRESIVFEVDHPATQAKKKALFASEQSGAHVEYLRFDFEQRSVAELPAALAAQGHRREQRTLTIWEGVTMYLTEDAIDATITAVREYSAPESLIAMSYFEKTKMIDKPSLTSRILHTFVSSLGEPFRFGWDPGELTPWAEKRSMRVLSDRTEAELAHEYLPVTMRNKVEARGRHIAVLQT